MSEVLPQGEQNTTTQSDPQKRPSRRFIRIAGLLLIILSVAVGWFLLIGYLGWRSGEQLLVEQQAAALAEQLSHQKELAATDISQQKYDLALRRLEWVMQQTPNDQEALNLQQQAANGLSALLTPTPSLPQQARLRRHLKQYRRNLSEQPTILKLIYNKFAD